MTSRALRKKQESQVSDDLFGPGNSGSKSKVLTTEKVSPVVISDNLAHLMDEDDKTSEKPAKEVKLNLKTTPRVRPEMSEEPKSTVEMIKDIKAKNTKYKGFTEEMLLYLTDTKLHDGKTQPEIIASF